MQTIKQYIQHTKRLIRNKEAHDVVEKELTYHLEKSKHAWLEKGYSDIDAEQQAVREMGNATKLGISLNQIHQPKIDWLLIISFLIAAFCSFLPLLPAEFLLRDSIIRNIVIVSGGIVTTIVLMRLDFRKLERYSIYLYVLTCVLFLIILNGNQVMNGIIFFKIGPLELKGWMTLPLFLIAFAGLFAKAKKSFWWLLILYSIGVYFYILLPDISLFFTYTAIVASLFYASNFSRRQKLACTVAFSFLFICVIGYLLIAPLKPYQLTQMQTIYTPGLEDASTVIYISNMINYMPFRLHYLPYSPNTFLHSERIRAIINRRWGCLYNNANYLSYSNAVRTCTNYVNANPIHKPWCIPNVDRQCCYRLHTKYLSTKFIYLR